MDRQGLVIGATDRNYHLRLPSGTILWRNRRHIRKKLEHQKETLARGKKSLLPTSQISPKQLVAANASPNDSSQVSSVMMHLDHKGGDEGILIIKGEMVGSGLATTRIIVARQARVREKKSRHKNDKFLFYVFLLCECQIKRRRSTHTMAQTCSERYDPS